MLVECRMKLVLFKGWPVLNIELIEDEEDGDKLDRGDEEELDWLEVEEAEEEEDVGEPADETRAIELADLAPTLALCCVIGDFIIKPDEVVDLTGVVVAVVGAAIAAVSTVGNPLTSAI